MKTYRSPIKEGFVGVGIKLSANTKRNSGLFVSCKNARVTKEGLEGYLPDVNSIMDGTYTFRDHTTTAPITITKRWPFPQLFLTDVGIFIGALEGLYFVEHTGVVTDLYDYATGAVTWPWTCANIMQRPAFASGDVLVYYEQNDAAYKVIKA